MAAFCRFCGKLLGADGKKSNNFLPVKKLFKRYIRLVLFIFAYKSFQPSKLDIVASLAPKAIFCVLEIKREDLYKNERENVVLATFIP